MNNSTYCPTMKIRVNIFTMFSPVKHITWINYLHCEHFWCEAKSFHNSMQYLAAILIWKSIPRHAISNSGKRTFFTKHFCDVVKIPNVGENLDGTELHWPAGWNSRQHRILINLHSSMSFYVCTWGSEAQLCATLPGKQDWCKADGTFCLLSSIRVSSTRGN